MDTLIPSPTDLAGDAAIVSRAETLRPDELEEERGRGEYRRKAEEMFHGANLLQQGIPYPGVRNVRGL